MTALLVTVTPTDLTGWLILACSALGTLTLIVCATAAWAACAAGGHQDDHTDADATENQAPVNGLTYDVDPWPGHTP